ncbi:MAG: phosphatidylserine decarboxylase proenzyme [Caldimonas sp.]|uniref:phosphatidylserine decarboxylase n=1 Tax=Caldimonas taiwanensis TaxID=307483 RepID=UPI000782A5A5|nr:phosphatidylserine decarboxylase [Caldimonas taiwanensis]GIX25043.1 MAG: phosphatidylserine decarboxylase proenzyme [Caldimonas sp.]
MNYPHPFLAKEGWPFIAIAFFVAVFASFFLTGFVAILCWLVLAFVVQFFRDPPRPVPADVGAVLSPADGRIVKVEKVRDPYADRDALLISVFMNVFNVHSNRISVDGRVVKVQYFPGLFINADLDKASLENERNAVVIESGPHTVTLVQVAGLIARRILCYVRPGDVVEKGQRYGFIRFGSRVDVYLPVEATPRVAPGDKVAATSTILALLPQQ